MSFFQTSVFSPPWHASGTAVAAPQASLAFGTPSREVIHVVAETLLHGSTWYEVASGTSNGAAQAALFLGRLTAVSKSLRRTALNDALWAP